MRFARGVPLPVALSIRIYAWLLAAYPGPFRAEYGDPMAQVFGDAGRRDYRHGGLGAMVWLWARTALDLARTTVEQHIERGIDMSRDKFVRWSGWALIAGAILFAAGLIIGDFDSDWSDPIGGVDAFYEIGQIVGIFLGQTLIMVGLLGLRAGFARRSGGLGAVALAVALNGGVFSLAGLLTMNLFQFAWWAWSIGVLTMTLALAAFGIAALRRRVFSRWNFAPILAVVTLPAMLGLVPAWASPIAVAGISAGLILLGYRMHAEVSGSPEGAPA